MNDDPGLQPQRTTLAWTRTGIGCAALTGILIRHAVLTKRAVDITAATLAALATVSVLVLGRLRRQQIRAALERGLSPAVPRAVAGLTLLVCLAAIAVTAGIAVDELSQ
jgi:uncharacterized membrane protein YidH (DUF202 family)